MTTSMKLTGFALLSLVVSGLAHGQWANNTGTQAPESPATAQVVVTLVDWVKTVVGNQAAQTPVLKERGTMYIAADGRVRDEKYVYRGSEKTLVVRLLDYVNNTKLVLDFALQVADSSPLRRTRPPGQGLRSTYTVGSTLVTDNMKAPLGEKIVSGLTLEGDRQTMNLNTPNGTIFSTHETWIYRLDAYPGAVIVMEHRHEDGSAITDQRITQVSTVTISEDMLELPADFIERIGQ